MGLQENLLNEPVRQLALREAITTSPDLPLREVIQRMREKGLGCVLVVDAEAKPIGMFTEAMLRHLLVENRAALDHKVGQEMANIFPWVELTDPISTVLDAMQTKRHRFVAVVDADGKVAGLTGQKGVMEYIADHFPQHVLTQRAGAEPPLSEREGA